MSDAIALISSASALRGKLDLLKHSVKKTPELLTWMKLRGLTPLYIRTHTLEVYVSWVVSFLLEY